MPTATGDAKFKDLTKILEGLFPDRSMDQILLMLEPDHHCFRRGLEPTPIELDDASLEVCGGYRLVVGGGGVIVQCRDTKIKNYQYALKIPRPSKVSARSKKEVLKEIDLATAEENRHKLLSHTNVARVVGSYTFKLKLDKIDTRDLPALVVEWVSGAKPLDEYIADNLPQMPVLFGLLVQSLKAIGHLHSKEYIHWDIKGDNLLVNDDGVVKLMDIGNARGRRDKSFRYRNNEYFYSSLYNLPLALQKMVGDLTASASRHGPLTGSLNRTPGKLEKGSLAWDRDWLDLYMFARMVNRVLGFATIAEYEEPKDDKERERLERFKAAPARIFDDSEEGKFAKDYLSIVFRRLLATDGTDKPPFYETADDVIRHLNRYEPEFGAAKHIQELRAIPQHVNRVPSDINVPWTPRVAVLMDSEMMRRLKGHKQLASTTMVYEGAQHTRREHSAGTLLATVEYVRALYADRTNPFFRIHTSELDVNALLLLALIHDMGHPAMGHYLEELAVFPHELAHEQYLAAVFGACLGKRDLLPRDYPQTVSQIETDAAELWSIADRYWKTANFSSTQLIQRALEIITCPYNPDAAEIKTYNCIRSRDDAKTMHLQILHSIIDGSMDVDKYDYVERDGYHCGVAYPRGVDKKRLLQSMTTNVYLEGKAEEFKSDRLASICVTEKGILPLESLIIARYQLFRAVYWQHTGRALTSMFKTVLEYLALPSWEEGKELSCTTIDEICAAMRERNDQDSFEWLRDRVKSACGDPTALPLPDTEYTRSRLVSMCDALLGDRSRLYKCVFERTNHGHAEAGSGVVKRKKNADDQLFDLLFERFDKLKTTPPEPGSLEAVVVPMTAAGVVRARRRIQNRFVLELNRSLEELSVSDNLQQLNNIDVIIDVPVRSNDQIEQLYVLCVETGAPAISDLHEMTSIAGAVKDAFHYSVRAIRIFINPDKLREIEASGISRRVIAESIPPCLRSTLLFEAGLPDKPKRTPRALKPAAG